MSLNQIFKRIRAATIDFADAYRAVKGSSLRGRRRAKKQKHRASRQLSRALTIEDHFAQLNERSEEAKKEDEQLTADWETTNLDGLENEPPYPFPQ